MRKQISIIVISVIITSGLYFFLLLSEADKLPVFHELIDSLLWSSFSVFATIQSLIWISKQLNSLLPWKVSFGRRFITGFLANVIVSFIILGLLQYLYLKIFNKDYILKNLFDTYYDAFWKIIILVCFLLFIYTIIDLLIYAYYQYAKEQVEAIKTHTKQLELQYQTLKNQLTPHFLFNSLNAIPSLLYQDIEKTDLFIRSLATSYKKILDSIQFNLITVAEELTIVRMYKYLMEVRFPEALQIEVDINEIVCQTLIPPLSIQLLVENAIKHNELSIENPLRIEIRVYENDYILVKNNCIKKSYYVKIDNQIIKDPEENTTMIGLNNILSRYGYFSGRKIQIHRNETFEVFLPILDKTDAKRNIFT
ncbi:MAG: histidine kinase [Bacteroidales bacterium]|nr:histidine kinase [Bacteroidales bacterium]